MGSCSYDNEEELFAEVHNQQQNQDSTQNQVSFDWKNLKNPLS